MIKRDFDWLWRAIKKKSNQIIHISDDCGFTSDGFRLHVINIKCLPKRVDIDSVLDATIRIGNVTSEVLVNPDHLIDALSGFAGSDTVKFEIVDCDSFVGLRLSDKQPDNKMAFVCCRGENDKSN